MFIRIFLQNSFELKAPSVLGHRRIHLIAPGEDAADKVLQVREAFRLELVKGVGAAFAGAAMQDDLGVEVQFSGWDRSLL